MTDEARATASSRAHVAMLIFAFLVSSSFTVGEAITDRIDPAALTFARFTLAALIFLVIILAGGRHVTRPSLSDAGRYGWLALLLVVFFITMFESLRLTSALRTGVVFTLVPPMTAVISWFALGQRLNLRETTALVVAGLAAGWVVIGGSSAMLDDLGALDDLGTGRGEAIFFIGCASYAAYSPSVRAMRGSDSLVALTFWTLVFGLVLLALYGWRTIFETSWLTVPGFVYLGIAHLAVFTTAISFYLIQYASTRLGSAKVMAYTYLIPVFVVAQTTTLGAPWPSWSVLLGVGIIASAMVMLQSGKLGNRQ